MPGPGVVTAGGDLHGLDVLILATGFQVMDVENMTFPIHGRGGRSLGHFWAEHRLQAYEGVSVPGFPNFFTVFEAQTHHIVRCLRTAQRRRATRVEVRQANSYYFDINGDVPLRPASTLEAYWRSRRFPIDDYEFVS